MDFKAKRARVEVDGRLSEKYRFPLQMYVEPPQVLITLNEFEELAVERLKVLRVLEAVTLKGNTGSCGGNFFEEWTKTVMMNLSQQGLHSYRKLITHAGTDDDDPSVFELRQRDHVSHFILRVAYCQSDEYRRWFVQRELELFKLRWSYLRVEVRRAFLKTCRSNASPVDKETLNYLNAASNGFVKANATVEYYRVNWSDVIDLVRTRRVYLEKGEAFISSDELISVLGAAFRSNLSQNLVVMSHRLPVIHEDERLKRMMKNLHCAYTGKNYGVSNDSGKSVSLRSLDYLAKTSFPLCMKQMYTALKSQHHLRHNARQQLSLFLKGIGLSFEDALVFWRSEFTKKIDGDQFEKKYVYNIRHNYGKEGKKTNYTPYSCVKIINSNPAAAEYHGCPFKHNAVANLKQIFHANNISHQDVNEILQYVNASQYQMACGKYFEVMHKVPSTPVIHPNQYFEESSKIKSNDKFTNVVAAAAANSSSNATTERSAASSNFDGRPTDNAKMAACVNHAELAAIDWDNVDNI